MTNKDYERLGHSGQLAWKRLKTGGRDWGDWLTVGELLMAGREVAMRGANTNQPEGAAYNQLFSQWLTRYGLKDMDASDRARLLKVMGHLGEIHDWRQSLTTTERLKLNHPSTVWRHWQKATKVKPVKPMIRGRTPGGTQTRAARPRRWRRRRRR